MISYFPLRLAAFSGLVVGFLKVGNYLLKPLFRQPSSFLWMPPFSELFLFILIGLAFFSLTLLLPKRFHERVNVTFILFVGFSHLRLISGKVHQLAWLIFAAGLALQVSLILSKKPFLRAFISRSSIILLILAATNAGVVLSWQVIQEKSAIEKLPKASPEAPNVILIVLDTVRAKSLSLYGYHRKTTPNLEKLAKKAVVFTETVATSSWTLPSHGSLFSGRYPHEFSGGWQNAFTGNPPTLAGELQQLGYMTAGFVANLSYGSFMHGLNRGFIHYEDFPLSLDTFIFHSMWGKFIAIKIRKNLGKFQDAVEKDAQDINRDFLSWLAKREPSRPFFAFLNYFDAHTPFLPPPPYDTMFGAKRQWPADDVGIIAPWLWRQFNSADKQVMLDAYEGGIAYLDHQVGLLLEELEESGILKNTLLIVTSDHGEQFGTKGHFGHGNSLYYSTLRVPLLFSFPTVLPQDTTVRRRVSLSDVPKTVTELLGFEKTKIAGNSLSGYWRHENSRQHNSGKLISEVRKGIGVPDWLLHSKGDMKSLVHKDLHYIRNGDGVEELYHLGNDPNELVDLALTPKYADLLLECRMELNKAFAQ